MLLLLTTLINIWRTFLFITGSEDDNSIGRGKGFRVPPLKYPIHDVYNNTIEDRPRFLTLCGLSPHEFTNLLRELRKNILYPRNVFYQYSEDVNRLRRRRHSRLTIENRLLMFLDWMRSGSSLLHLTMRYGLSPAMISAEIKHVRKAMYDVLAYEISWPEAATRQSYNGLVPGFPDCIGFIDATCTPIRRPMRNQRLSYRSDKGYNILNQVVVDPWGQIIHVFFGGDGSTNNRGFFSHSPLCMYPDQYFSDGEYVLGDGGYRGYGPVVVPYLATAAEGDAERSEYNRSLRSSRVIVEWVFAHVYNRFGALRLGITFWVACLMYNRLCRIRKSLVTPQNIIRRCEQFE